MKRFFLLAGVLMLTGGLSTMNAEVIYVTENGVGDGMSWNSAAPWRMLFMGCERR